MGRIKINKKEREIFFNLIKIKSGLSWSELSNIAGISDRTLRGWKSGKYTINKDSFDKLLNKYCKSELIQFKVLPDFWHIEEAARKGGISHFLKYGSPATPEGIRKGGINSQRNRVLYPELYQNCSIKKEILYPKYSENLAEFFGIVLGDGGINSKYQIIITLNKVNDALYVFFVVNLIENLFGIKPAIYKYKNEKDKSVVGVTISSVATVDFLIDNGLKFGNKVKQQSGVPEWILNNREFSMGCMRGLIDTDGGVYYHNHKSHGYDNFNIGLAFANRSLPLLFFVKDQLEFFGFHPKANHRSVSLYREKEVFQYIKEIQFHNPYHFKRAKQYLEIKKGKGV